MDITTEDDTSVDLNGNDFDEPNDLGLGSFETGGVLA